jgi:protein-S-isoprenylcysteine O-methyltransferase Ste14
MSVGLTISSQSLMTLIACLLLVILFMIKARFEEKLLLATYPEYSAYAARVGRFIPGVGKLPTS